MSEIKAGWYDDPEGSGGRRYWDGQVWTDQVERGDDVIAPPAAPAAFASAHSSSSASANGSPNTLWMGVGIIVALAVLGLTGRAVLGSGSGGDGDQARYCSTYEQLATVVDTGDTAQARSIMAELADSAPSASRRADAEVVVEAYDKVLAGDALSVDEAKVTAALDRLDGYTNQTCS